MFESLMPFVSTLSILILLCTFIIALWKRENFALALKNLIKNRRRSLIILCVITSGLAGLMFFFGYAEYIIWILREMTIRSGIGHMQLYKKGYNETGYVDKLKYNIPNYSEIADIIGNDPFLKDKIKGITAEIEFMGIASSDISSSIFMGKGVEVDKDKLINTVDFVVDGKPLEKTSGQFKRKEEASRIHEFEGMFDAFSIEGVDYKKGDKPSKKQIDPFKVWGDKERKARSDTPEINDILIGFGLCKTLKAEPYLFKIEKRFQKILDNGEISEELRRFFKDAYSPLSQDVSVEVLKKNEEWMVVDKGNKRNYRIVKKAWCTKCPQCSEDVQEDATSCSKCGLKLGESALNIYTEPGNSNPLTLIVSTKSGAVNALDVNVRGIIQGFSKGYDDSVIKMSLECAWILMNRKDVSKICILLKDTAMTNEVSQRIQEIIAEKKLDLEQKIWRDIALHYNNTHNNFVAIFMTIGIMITIVVFFSITNTMTMSVMERTREIGTLRALGNTRFGIMQIFLIEGCIIGVIGGLVSVLFGIGITELINSLGGIPHPPVPGSGHTEGYSVYLYVSNRPVIWGITFLLTFFCAFLSSILPARKASSMEIVDSLHYV